MNSIFVYVETIFKMPNHYFQLLMILTNFMVSNMQVKSLFLSTVFVREHSHNNLGQKILFEYF